MVPVFSNGFLGNCCTEVRRQILSKIALTKTLGSVNEALVSIIEASGFLHWSLCSKGLPWYSQGSDPASNRCKISSTIDVYANQVSNKSCEVSTAAVLPSTDQSGRSFASIAPTGTRQKMCPHSAYRNSADNLPAVRLQERSRQSVCIPPTVT